MRLAGGDHREAVLVFLHQAIKDHRTVVVQHLHDRIIEVIRVLANDTLRPKGFREFHKVGQGLRPALRIPLAVQQLLPLAHHAKAFVVQDELLHRQVVLHGRAHLLHVHQPRGFASHVDHQRLWVGKLHADRGGEAVTHRAQTARGHPVVGIFKAHVLRRPHLVLAHLGTDKPVLAVLGQRLKTRQRMLWLDGLAGLRELQAIHLAPFIDLIPPL